METDQLMHILQSEIAETKGPFLSGAKDPRHAVLRVNLACDVPKSRLIPPQPGRASHRINLGDGDDG